MQIGILGTGVVGQTLAAALAAKGHAVTIGTRDPAATLARETAKPPAKVAFRDWQRANPTVKLATFADAVRSADVVINATSGTGAMSALEDAGADALGDRSCIDASNPLDFSKGSAADALGGQHRLARRAAAASLSARAAREDAEHRDGGADGQSCRRERRRSYHVRLWERRRREGDGETAGSASGSGGATSWISAT